VFRATLVSTVLVGLGSISGMGRDLLIAAFFGADGSTDAFVVAWTLPETAIPLLIDVAMPLLLIPAFTRALAVAERSRDHDASADAARSVETVVASILPQVLILMLALSALTAATAPWLVPLLAPGLADPALGITAMRIVSLSLVLVAAAGFMVGALRAHLVFGPPAAISLALNAGVIGTILAFHDKLGVMSAAVGVTVGTVLMVAVQLPAYLRRLPLPRRIVLRTSLVSLGAFVPIAVYTLTRQAQVYVERFVASSLPPGTISHLNYAQKIGQLPATIALILATVTFPLLARSIVQGEDTAARQRIETDVRVIAAVVLLATAVLFVFAPVVVEVLFERGAFSPADTVATGAILRLYVLGLLGQALVEIIVRAVLGARNSYVPAALMGVGLVVTATVAIVAAPILGAAGIALANAAGISTTAVLLLSFRRGRPAAVVPALIVRILLRLLPAPLAAAAVGSVVSDAVSGQPPLLVFCTGSAAMTVVFAVTAAVTGALPLPRTLGRSPSR
jgi:putative peptidoglycan lipid II flippase